MVGVFHGKGQVVEHQNQGFAAVCQKPGKLHQLQLMPDVQIGSGLVQQQNLSILSQSHSKIDLLPLSAGQGGNAALRQITDAQLLHGLPGNPVILRAVVPGIG